MIAVVRVQDRRHETRPHYVGPFPSEHAASRWVIEHRSPAVFAPELTVETLTSPDAETLTA